MVVLSKIMIINSLLYFHLCKQPFIAQFDFLKKNMYIMLKAKLYWYAYSWVYLYCADCFMQRNVDRRHQFTVTFKISTRLTGKHWIQCQRLNVLGTPLQSLATVCGNKLKYAVPLCMDRIVAKEGESLKKWKGNEESKRWISGRNEEVLFFSL